MAQGVISLKLGWLLVRFGGISTFAAAAALAAAQPRILFAGGGWAAIDFGARCEARTKALWAKTGSEPFAGFAFDPAGRMQGRLYVHLARSARPGASVVATIGAQPFLLDGKGQWAWARNEEQQRLLLQAARYGRSMRVESRDKSGRRIVDRYSLAGAATAIDAAAARCAGKSARQ